MSQEASYRVRIPEAEAELVRGLQRSAEAALERHRRAPISDRAEAVRYEQLQTTITRIAFAELSRGLAGAPSTHLSRIEIDVSWPFAVGSTPALVPNGPPKPVAATFKSSLTTGDRKAFSKERFERQLERWLETAKRQPAEPLNPGEIQNEALSEALRSFIARETGSTQVNARVVYSDGSEARTLPLRSLPLSSSAVTDRRRSVNVTLLSIRHMEMDIAVDGAWLRNSEISLRRPAADTDELVYQQSLEQLALLTQHEPIELHLYQTGLPQANIGFYRAAADHHLLGLGYPAAIMPYYYRGPRRRFKPGTAWVVA